MDTVGGVIAHPMFPVCIEWPVQVAMRAQFENATSLTRDEAMRAVHATHDTVLYRAIRPPERLTTQLTVAGVERRKPGAYMVTRLDTVDEAGKPVCTSWYGAIYRGVEVKGSDAPPNFRRHRRNRSSRKASRCRNSRSMYPRGWRTSTPNAREFLIRYTPTPGSHARPDCPK